MPRIIAVVLCFVMATAPVQAELLAAVVTNNAALSKLAPDAGYVKREGFSHPDEREAAHFTTTATLCPQNFGAGDGGSCIGLTGPKGSVFIGSAQIDRSAVMSPRIWGANGGNDSAAWAYALAYLGSLKFSAILDASDLPASTISGPILTIPSNVEVNCGKSYEGGDGLSAPSSLNTITFTSLDGGFYMDDQSSIAGCNLISHFSDHLIEIGGKVGIEHVRVSSAKSGVLTTHNIVSGRGTLDSIGSVEYTTPGIGLKDGLYVKVPFTGGDGVGATVSLTVRNGSLRAGVFDSNGKGYVPTFQMGLAADALYKGSPPLDNIATGVIVNVGRSHVDHLFVSSTGFGIGLELDGGFDFTDAGFVEVWNASKTIRNGSVGFRFGKIDGLVAAHFKCFGYNTCYLGNGPSKMSPNFQTFTDPQCDYANTCIRVTHPVSQLAINGGYMRATSYAVNINNIATRFSLTGTVQDCQAVNCTYIQSVKSGTISGNSYGRDRPNSRAYIQISPDASDGSLVSVIASGNSFDLNGPGFYLGATSNNASVGQNSWPFGSTFGYITGPYGAHNQIAQNHTGQIQAHLDSRNAFLIPHGLGYRPLTPTATIIGTTLVRAVVTGIDSTNILVTIVDAQTGIAATRGVYTIVWGA